MKIELCTNDKCPFVIECDRGQVRPLVPTGFIQRESTRDENQSYVYFEPKCWTTEESGADTLCDGFIRRQA